MVKRNTIKKKVRYLILTVTLIAVFAVSVATMYFMVRIRTSTRTTVVDEMESKVSNIVTEKVINAEKTLTKYTNYINMLVSLIGMLYENPNNFARIDIPKRLPNSPKEYMSQRSFVNQNVTINDVKDELTLLANLEAIWSPMMNQDGQTIATTYVGTESGFMISFDENASLAEYSEDGEVYFNHKDRTWYKRAKTEKTLIFTDLSQDFFGRGLSLTCAAPFYNNGKFAGVVAMDILIKDLQDEIINIDLGEGSYAFLVNEVGNIIASPFLDKNSIEFESIGGLKSEYLSVSSKILSYKSGMVYTNGFYIAYEPIKIAHWVLCVRIPQSLIMQPVNAIDNIILRMITIFIAVFLAVALFSFVATHVFATKLTDPILALKDDVSKISDGDLDYVARVTGNDEISDLANSFNSMTQSLKNYIKDLTSLTAEKERIGAELNVATHIQSSMLPSIFPAFPKDASFDIFATMNPAKEVGGDFYDFFKIDDKHIAIVVADVSGKGVPAALFMVIGKTLIKDHTGLNTNLADVFYDVNNILCESNSENLFITAFEAIINLETGKVHYVNAGHEMPYIYKKGKEWTAYQMKPGFVLAGMENMKFSAGEFTLEVGDKIFQYTDGVTEATSANNELYGMDRLKAALDANSDKKMEDLLPAIKADIDKFVGEAPQFDDITMLGFEFKG